MYMLRKVSKCEVFSCLNGIWKTHIIPLDRHAGRQTKEMQWPKKMIFNAADWEPEAMTDNGKAYIYKTKKKQKKKKNWPYDSSLDPSL